MRLEKAADAVPVIAVLSTARMSKYSAAKPAVEDAVELYGWNAIVSAALMVPAHFVEVLVRNAVSDALTAVYGASWPWSPVFEVSLPAPRPPAYRPRKDLQQVRSRHTTTGKVIADLRFAFWQSMFTARHDVRLWNPTILSLFPNTTDTNPDVLRRRIYDDLEQIRLLRNRVAHHEPLITRNLTDDLARMLDLVELRSAEAHTWLTSIEEASTWIGRRP